MATTSPTVRATAGGASAAALTVNRPSWADMNKHYPSESTTSDTFYSMVGKNYVAAMGVNPEGYQNTCAARMSYALNRSGMKLPAAPDGGNMKGDDGLNYWLRVKQLSTRLKNQFDKPDKELKHTRIERTSQKDLIKERMEKTDKFLSEIKVLKGIVVFEVDGWKDASGHFTLWDGQNLKYVGAGDHNNRSSDEYYFWFLRTLVTDKVVAQTTRVLLWELK
jgi:Type VI secretion system (T6SS), amidase effector protein 4